jgi:antitoxin MazE
VLYHQRALKRLGMVEERFATASIKTQIVGWGNRLALRIPRALLEELQIGEGDEVEMSVENGRLTVRPASPKLRLESLVAAITPQNQERTSRLAVKHGKRELRPRYWPHY